MTAVPPTPKKRPRVLVTDDSAAQRAAIRRELEPLGLEIFEAENGLLALKAIREVQPHLVTVDIEMPVFNGFRVIEQLRARDETMTTPVIMISGLPPEEQRLKALEAGAIEYFRKPFPKGELRSLVQDLLAQLESNRSRRIACIDASDELRTTVKQQLQLHGYCCDVFDSAEAFLKSAGSMTCDLVLIDLHLKQRGTYEVLEALRNDSEWSAVPKVGMTRDGKRKEVLSAFHLGLDDFVRKPFYREHLLVRVEHQLRVKDNAQRLKKLATVDPLTGLHNRGEITRRIAAEISRSRREHANLGVLMIDIDHFKRINDTFGHPFGDKVLRVVAQRVREDLRVTDVVGRYGGEEFVALCPKVTPTGMELLADRVRQRVEELRFTVEAGEIDVSISIGGCVWEPDSLLPDMTLEPFIKPADKALYAAKEGGRNRVVLMSPPPNISCHPPPSSLRCPGRLSLRARRGR